ncbi:MAG: ABC transporter ATP-binding protein [Gammaproteobacteria bacterium]|nr:ABC transporter ATP-binding protein [Gammaproteobacteria bacterium]
MSLIQLDAVSKHYGAVRALDNLTLELNTGAPIALIGPNGAGKTTLISILCGYILRTEGSARILGELPGSRGLVGRISAMPQDAQMDPNFTLLQQLTYYARLQGFERGAAQNEANRVLEIVQLPDVAEKEPAELSHGMRKRVSLAQALIGSPEVILLDEPTAGIDPPNVKIIRDLIGQMVDKATFIISSHNLDELEKLCSTVVYLENGRLSSHGAIDTDDKDVFLTVRLIDVPADAFISAASAIPGVESVEQRAQGEFLLTTTIESVVDVPLLTLLREKHWSYRQLHRGRSLEERLYGETG